MNSGDLDDRGKSLLDEAKALAAVFIASRKTIKNRKNEFIPNNQLSIINFKQCLIQFLQGNIVRRVSTM